jgi:rhodanese-related sulfurtransferase
LDYVTMLKSPADLVAIARTSCTECSVADAHEYLQANSLLIDVREPAEFQKNHIDGAAHLPRGLLEFEIHKLVGTFFGDADVPEHKCPIIVYCGTGGRSALSAQSLQSLGYQDVKSMAGGLTAWKAANLPLTSDTHLTE